MRRLDRPRRLSALQRQHLPDDDPARRCRRQRLHAGAGRGPLRRDARAGARLHRTQGRHLRQHPGRPRDRRQDRRPADRAVRIARVRDRARAGALSGSRPQHHRERRPRAHVQGARDDAPRPRHRLRSGAARPRPARSRAAEGDLPALRVPQSAEPHRRARRGGAERADEGDRHRSAVAGRRARLPRRRRLRSDRRPWRCGDRQRSDRRQRAHWINCAKRN